MTERTIPDSSESPADELLRFALDLDFDSCPEAALETAERSIIDTVGVALAGRDEESARIVTEYVDTIAANGSAHPLGRDKTYPPEFAALISGMQGHALDFDDVTYTFPIHPSVTFVPTLLALGESTNASGQDLLSGFVAAFEFEIRVAGGIGDRLLGGGFHPTGVVGVFGATVAAARLLDLPLSELRRAIGIAASLASGSTSNFGTMTKPLHAGQANANGIRAVRLADAGFVGNHAILDEPSGPWPNAFDDFDLAEWTADLGDRWYAAEGIGIKKYPSCGCTHAAIDAAVSITERHSVDAGSVSRVDVESVPAAVDQLRYEMPETPLQGKFSMHYCVATALLDGTVTLDHFTDAAIDRPAVRDLVEKTTFDVDDDLGGGTYVGGSMPSRVRLTTVDGDEFERTVMSPSGTPESPLTREELATKFRTCASRALTDDVDVLLRVLGDLESIEDTAQLSEILTR